jgi:hypothetical protein
MISTNIYTPYFYIIQHKSSKKMYAGAKWAKGCNPNEFMKPKGYHTSSVVIADIIEQEGLSAFIVLRIDTNCDNLHPFDYETAFLKHLDCANSSDWYNETNNSKGFISSNESHASRNKTMVARYGSTNVYDIPEVPEKILASRKETMITKYGVEHNMQIPGLATEANKKAKKTKLEKYGSESYNNVEQHKKTKLEKYGSETFNNREQSKQTSMEKYGVDNPSKTPDARKKNSDKIFNAPIIYCNICNHAGKSPSIYRHIAKCKAGYM